MPWSMQYARGLRTPRRLLRPFHASRARRQLSGRAAGDATTATADPQWTLYSALDLQEDADRLRLATFIERLRATAIPAAAVVPAPEPAVAGGRLDLAFDRSFSISEKQPQPVLTVPVTAAAAATCMSSLRDGRLLPPAELRVLLRSAATSLAALPSVVELPPLGTTAAGPDAMTIVGDLHGQVLQH